MALASGISRQSRRAGPISTLISPFPAASASSRPDHGLDHHMAAAVLLHQQIGDAARGIAAGLDLPAVGIADAHEGIGEPVLRRLDQDQLIAADTLAPVGDAPRLRLIERDRVPARVDNDEVVAEAMHLEKGQRGHDGRLYGLLTGPSPWDSAPYSASSPVVIPAQAGIQGKRRDLWPLDPRFRGDDGRE